MKRASIKPAIYLAILLCAAQVGARTETVLAWSRQFNVAYIVGMAKFQAQLQANPSADKGVTIGVPAKFDRMVSENIAIFRGGVLPGVGDTSPDAQIVISNVPAGQFSAGDTFVLAFKILGMHPEYGLPHGQFVAAHRCMQPRCLDFLG
jgi:hypothetical protein